MDGVCASALALAGVLVSEAVTGRKVGPAAMGTALIEGLGAPNVYAGEEEMTSKHTSESLARAMRDAMSCAYSELIDFACTNEFQKMLQDLYRLPSSKRPHFVQSVILSNKELSRRGVLIPKGILIQRSSF